MKNARPVFFLLGDLSGAGGSERVMCLWARVLNQTYEVQLADETGGPSFFDVDDVPIKALPMHPDQSAKTNPFILLIRLWRFLRLVGLRRPSTFLMTKSVYLSVFPLLRLFPTTWPHRFVYYTHNSVQMFSHRFPKPVAFLILSSLSRLVCLYDEGTALPGFFRRKLAVLGNPSPFKPRQIQDQENKREILYLGRLSPEKGLDLLFGAWKKLQDDPLLQDWSLRLVGGGPEEATLKALAESLQLRRLTWVPEVRDVVPEYQRAGLFVMTSHFEGLPMSMIEAMSFGVPIVTTDHTGAQQLLTGPLEQGRVKSREVDDYAHVLMKFMKDPALRHSLSEKAREKAALLQPERNLSLWKDILT